MIFCKKLMKSNLIVEAPIKYAGLNPKPQAPKKAVVCGLCEVILISGLEILLCQTLCGAILTWKLDLLKYIT